MKVTIIIDENCREQYVEIHAPAATDDLAVLAERISSVAGNAGDFRPMPMVIPAYSGDRVTFLRPTTVMRIYSYSKKVFAQTEDCEYELKLRLYEAESILDKQGMFVRVSNTEIVNFDYVSHLDLSMSGVICVYFKNNIHTFISRRYVRKVMSRLGVEKI